LGLWGAGTDAVGYFSFSVVTAAPVSPKVAKSEEWRTVVLDVDASRNTFESMVFYNLSPHKAVLTLKDHRA
jgi:hypothetical protein